MRLLCPISGTIKRYACFIPRPFEIGLIPRRKGFQETESEVVRVMASEGGMTRLRQLFAMGTALTCLFSAEVSAAKAPAPRPNFLVIVVDDLGFTDIGAFGGEIDTPNIDRLARDGRMLTNFHVAPACSMTRAELLTGVDHHEAGFGNFVEQLRPNQKGRAGYEGYLNDRVVSLAQLMQDGGYRTFMSGKWHLGFAPEHDPSRYGFEHVFAMIGGMADHFGGRGATKEQIAGTIYREDGNVVTDLPKNFYSSDFYAAKMIDYLSGPDAAGRPFFAYLAFTAAHWPLQAPRETIAKYKGRYDGGWEALRQARLSKAKSLGIVPNNVIAHPLVPNARAWDALSPDQKRYESRKMEVYAAMVDRVDQRVGDVIESLKKTGQYNNTIILFMSDNGPEGNELEKSDNAGDVGKRMLKAADNSYESLGSANSYFWYGPYWAQASSSPFRLFKTYPTEGGTRVSAVVTGVGKPSKGMTVDDQFVSVTDVAPTILQLSGIAKPAGEYRGRKVLPYRGRSAAAYLTGQAKSVHSGNSVQGWELFGRKSIRLGNWKAVYIPDGYGTGQWELFDLSRDMGETNDVSRTYPKLVTKLSMEWEAYAVRTGIVLPEQPGQ